VAKSKTKDLDLSRLCTAMRASRWMLEKFRSNRREMTREYVGHRWSEEGAEAVVPVNLLSLFISVVGRNLIAKNPRVLLSTFQKEAKPVVASMQAFANREIDRMELADTLQRVVVDALFSVGISKVALATPADAAEKSWQLRAGVPFVEQIDLDDFVFDAHARSFQDVAFMGHRYRRPLDTIRDSKLYEKSRKQLTESHDEPYNIEGDEKIKRLGMGYQQMMQQEYEPHVDLWEIYLPRHQLIVTLADSWVGGGEIDEDGPLRVQKWIGPYCGPYHILGYGTVPGNAMPKAPIQDLFDLHDAANRTYRKVMRTVDRIKEITAVRGGAMEDGSRVQQANDGDILRVDDPTSINQLVLGGQALQQILAVATVFNDLFSRQAGNLDVLGGLSPQAKTAHQEALLNENSSSLIADMQQRTVGYVSQVIESLCWYWHKDPIKTQTSIYSPRGMPGIQSQRKVTPQQRQQIPFDALEIKVDPYSMSYATPQTRMQALNQVVQQTIMPLMPLLQQQGIAFDLHTYLDKIASYMDQPDLAEILTVREPPENRTPSGGGGGEAPGMPQETTRNYVRDNVSSQTRQSSNNNLVSSLMGVDTGGAQKNGAMKPLGAV
jgi:hypothetical protein